MRFSSEMYDKAFPKQEMKTTIESAVETFKPSEADLDSSETEQETVVEQPVIEEGGAEDGRDGEPVIEQ